MTALGHLDACGSQPPTNRSSNNSPSSVRAMLGHVHALLGNRRLLAVSAQQRMGCMLC